ncbi:hypothetical protein BB558_001829 [Smittium angustum]|uniref:Uncharacterized protein n=1 Tax=Smittium angustum TaxID=133377 RepID=A0A2U1JAB6_SMIAN|nr:hypothetical protein BB558_001829 [Smittium angustum]
MVGGGSVTIIVTSLSVDKAPVDVAFTSICVGSWPDTVSAAKDVVAKLESDVSVSKNVVVDGTDTVVFGIIGMHDINILSTFLQ